MKDLPIDLSNCDREPIHIPGSVQPHAWMLVFSEEDFIVRHCSESSLRLGGLEAGGVVGRALETVLSPKGFDYLREHLSKPLDDSPHYLPPLLAGRSDIPFEALVHRREGLTILELERSLDGRPPLQEEVYGSLKHTLAQLQGTRTVQTFCQSAAEHVRRFTGFDRVMVYRFADDDSGLVIAEARQEGLGSYLGHHYPASDIPKQARELFRKSQLRLNPDVTAQPAPLIPPVQAATGKPLDMSYCVSRSVSPIHVEYLQNMGVTASLSISIVVGDKLWGLFACHHYSSRYVDHATRMACEFLAHMLSLQVGSKAADEQRDYAEKLATHCTTLAERLRQDVDFDQVLSLEPGVSFGGIQASGAAIVANGRIHLRGTTPSEAVVSRLARWVDEEAEDSVWATDRLAERFDDPELTPETSGLLVARLSQKQPGYIFWFRPEVPFVIAWAGDPNKPVLPGPRGDRLTPRKSFEIWREEVRRRSEPWLECELAAARSLRHSVLEASMRRAEQLMRFNAELEERNKQLDAFAHVASHDLKEPLRGIHNFSQFLLEDYASRLDEEGVQQLRTVVRLTQRMETLLDSLLYYSRLSRVELATAELDMDGALQSGLEMVAARLEERRMEVRVPRALPPARGDQHRLAEVFANLLSNAAKYSDKSEPWVEIGFIASPGDPTVYYVRDNGLGIAENNYETVFQIFRRLHGRDEFGGGVGAGLTIVRKIIERHGGRIWLESELGKGTTFYFTLNETDSDGSERK